MLPEQIGEVLAVAVPPADVGFIVSVKELPVLAQLFAFVTVRVPV
jgi:hypothetical protein